MCLGGAVFVGDGGDNGNDLFGHRVQAASGDVRSSLPAEDRSPKSTVYFTVAWLCLMLF